MALQVASECVYENSVVHAAGTARRWGGAATTWE